MRRRRNPSSFDDRFQTTFDTLNQKQAPQTGDRLMVGGKDMTGHAMRQRSPLQANAQGVGQTPPADSFTPSPTTQPPAQSPYYFTDYPNEPVNERTMGTLREAQGLSNAQLPPNISRREVSPPVDNFNPATQRPNVTSEYIAEGYESSPQPVVADPRQEVLDSFNTAFRGQEGTLTPEQINNANMAAADEGLVFDPQRGFRMATPTERTRMAVERTGGLMTDPQGRPIPAGFNSRADAFPDYERAAADRNFRAEQNWNQATEARRGGSTGGGETGGGVGANLNIPSDVRAILNKGGPSNEREAQRVADWENSTSGRSVGGLEGYRQSLRMGQMEQEGNLRNQQQLELRQQLFDQEVANAERLTDMQLGQEADVLEINTAGMTRADLINAISEAKALKKEEETRRAALFGRELDQELSGLNLMDQAEILGIQNRESLTYPELVNAVEAAKTQRERDNFSDEAEFRQGVAWSAEDRQKIRELQNRGIDTTNMTPQEVEAARRTMELSDKLGLDLQADDAQTQQVVGRLRQSEEMLTRAQQNAAKAMNIPPEELDRLEVQLQTAAMGEAGVAPKAGVTHRDLMTSNGAYEAAYNRLYQETMAQMAEARAGSPQAQQAFAQLNAAMDGYSRWLGTAATLGVPPELVIPEMDMSSGAPTDGSDLTLSVDEAMGTGNEAGTFNPQRGATRQAPVHRQGDLPDGVIGQRDGRLSVARGFWLNPETMRVERRPEDTPAPGESFGGRPINPNLPEGSSINLETGEITIPRDFYVGPRGEVLPTFRRANPAINAVWEAVTGVPAAVRGRNILPDGTPTRLTGPAFRELSQRMIRERERNQPRPDDTFSVPQ